MNEARAANREKCSAILKHLIQAEQNRRCYSAFRQHTKPKSAGGLAYITTTNEGNGERMTIMDSEEMDVTLLDYSRQHFATAQGTPFTVEPLQHLLQYDGLTPFGTRVLQGKAQLDELPVAESTKALLQHLKSKNPADEQLHPLIYDELQEGIKKWPEKTTTSPSGRHLGIYKSLQKHVIRKDDHKPPPLTPPPPITQG